MLRYKNRHRLRQKEIEDLKSELEVIFRVPIPILSKNRAIDTAVLKNSGFEEVIFVDGDIVALSSKSGPFLTLRGLLACDYAHAKRYVTIDEGAVRYICNGADVMAPGIVDADEDIAVEDLVWVRDEIHHKPLAIGRALISGKDMRCGLRGRAVRSLHYVGDELWNLSSKQWRAEHYDYSS